ncbi:uncharacterized protein LOC131010606 [Salvia miltiorrhiza]|uniref:uncharacterized protein LOC131010606 n=1 Tax=Salvia miltiorrhiza TaxID=226208 RepID=UPI0025ACCAEF|nr:uncharacterized protein LOC131010606 [Salvia miltiorrhiza]XP_057794192.1 uncharacterized protein LOC131010606 [Salvia miltiorrhiza]
MEESAPPSAALERVKKGFVAFGASLEEGFGYVRAAVVGFTKKLTAKSEEDATAADMQAAKMQVAAADRAEDIKKGLHH